MERQRVHVPLERQVRKWLSAACMMLARLVNKSGICMLNCLTMAICLVLPEKTVAAIAATKEETIVDFIRQYRHCQANIDHNYCVMPDETPLVRLGELGYYLFEKEPNDVQRLKYPYRFGPRYNIDRLYKFLLSQINPRCFVETSQRTLLQTRKLMAQHNVGIIALKATIGVDDVPEIVKDFTGRLAAVLYVEYGKEADTHTTTLLFDTRAKGVLRVCNDNCQILDQITRDSVTAKEGVTFVCLTYLFYNGSLAPVQVEPKQPKPTPPPPPPPPVVQKKSTRHRKPRNAQQTPDTDDENDEDLQEEIVFRIVNTSPIIRCFQSPDYNVFGDLIVSRRGNNLSIFTDNDGTAVTWKGHLVNEGFRCQFAGRKSGFCRVKSAHVPEDIEGNQQQIRQVLHKHVACCKKSTE